MDKDTFFSRVDKNGTNGCWIWQGSKDKRGYGRIRSQNAHRVAWELTNGAIPPGMYICHKCDNKPCVNPDHLFVGTALDNMRDSIIKGRGRFICLDRREKIADLYRSGDYSTTQISKMFGVSSSQVWRITREYGALPPELRRFNCKHLGKYPEMARLYSTGEFSMRDIAHKFGVSTSVVHRAIHHG